MINIQISDYNLFDYEIEFLIKEIKAFGGIIKGYPKRNAFVEIQGIPLSKALMLTYIKGVIENGKYYQSIQYLRERIGNGKRVQSKRYGPHSLHEYKGRYNHQMPRSLILSNFSKKKDIILDPFMGSGTTLVEARGLGFSSIGVELNPFACLVTGAKKYYEEVDSLPVLNIKIGGEFSILSFEQKEYLKKWFPQKLLSELETILYFIDGLKSRKEKVILKVILSNLLRDHSLQDPKDLRIRRRAEVPMGSSLVSSFLKSLREHAVKQKEWLRIIGNSNAHMRPIHGDSRNLTHLLNEEIQGTVCSPPYVSALPYVDTYRLSMVALGVIDPKKIIATERTLIGARDITKEDELNFNKNLDKLPNGVKKIANYIHREVLADNNAGFRKRAVPYGFVKYSYLMMAVLNQLFMVESKGARNLWVLGPNKVKLADNWYYINTPDVIGNLAEAIGFKNVRFETVQAYQRYNMHSKNSIGKESVLIFEKL